jgi:hypothetical protein
MLSISSFPNFPTLFLPFRHSTVQDRGQLSSGLLFFRREVLLARLRVDHQQIERVVAAMVKVDNASAAAFTASGAAPVTVAIPPLWGGTAAGIEVILVRRERKMGGGRGKITGLSCSSKLKTYLSSVP